MSEIEQLPQWQIKLLYDGECPLCLREVKTLAQRDAGRGIVAFVDIADLNYEPEQNGGVSYEDAMGRIHAVLPDGSVIQGVEVFRRVYAALGLGWVYAPTGWPIVNRIVDFLYMLWAEWRFALTGRPALSVLIAERERRLAANTKTTAECHTTRCRIEVGNT
ncbi:MAG TPA: DUF393 domain-containing protein [Stenomitos sp.]